VYGGFDPEDWSRDVAAFPTVINDGGEGFGANFAGDAPRVVLDGFVVVASGEFGVENGITFSGQLTLRDTVISAASGDDNASGVRSGTGPSNVLRARHNQIFVSSPGDASGVDLSLSDLGAGAILIDNTVAVAGANFTGSGVHIQLADAASARLVANVVSADAGSAAVGIRVLGSTNALTTELIANRIVNVRSLNATADGVYCDDFCHLRGDEISNVSSALDAAGLHGDGIVENVQIRQIHSASSMASGIGDGVSDFSGLILNSSIWYVTAEEEASGVRGFFTAIVNSSIGGAVSRQNWSAGVALTAESVLINNLIDGGLANTDESVGVRSDHPVERSGCTTTIFGGRLRTTSFGPLMMMPGISFR
jgi:hypothetical protein